MPTRSSKRSGSEISSSSYQDDHDSPRKRKKAEIAQLSADRIPTLLTLPYEIRIQILQEVVQATSPIRKRQDLCPSILRACKAFADDNRARLLPYESTFGADLWINESEGDSDMMTFLDYDISDRLETIPQEPQLLQRVKNLDLIIHVDHDRKKGLPPITDEDSMSYRNAVTQLLKPLKAMVSLENLTITVINKHQIAEDNTIGNDVLNSLKILRGLKCVTVNGVSSAHATEMKTAVESRKPVENLHAMRKSVRKYLGEYYYDDEDWEDIVYAVDTCDHELFKSTRAAIVTRIESARTALRMQLYRHDIV